MITPRVIATDLDGTLLRSDSVSDRTREALQITRAAGVRVVAATARPARVIEDLFGSEKLIDTAVCGNGAVRYEVGSHKILITHPLAQVVTRHVMAEISRLAPDAGFAVETGYRVLFEPGQIAATGVSKAAALATLCQEWEVDPAEVIAFGDGPNDLPMLAWAGTAHAVANARQRHKLYREHALSPATARQVKRYNGTVAALLLTCVADVLANGGYIAAVLLGTRLFPALLLLLALPILVGGLGVGVKVSALRQRPGIYPGASTPNFRCALRLSDRGSVATPPG